MHDVLLAQRCNCSQEFSRVTRLFAREIKIEIEIAWKQTFDDDGFGVRARAACAEDAVIAATPRICHARR